jgi:hypothetical protein
VSSRKAVSVIGTLVGVAVSALLVYLSVRRMNMESALAAWRSAEPLPWVPLAGLFYLAGHIVRGHRCELLVRGHAPLPLATATNVVVVGYASNNVFPARMGELVRAGLLAERTGIPVTQSLVVTFIERAYSTALRSCCCSWWLRSTPRPRPGFVVWPRWGA